MSKTITTPALSAAATKATTRMWDGAKWDTYKTGGKKHRAAEARRAAYEAAKVAKSPEAKAAEAAKAAERQVGNLKAAAWMRSKGIQPSGSAWKLVGKGERDVKILTAANVADGLKPVPEGARKAAKAKFKALQAGASVDEARALTAKATPAKAAKATKATKAPKAKASAPAPKAEPKVEVASPKAERKAAKRRSKAAKKAYATRVANGTAVRVNGKFVSAATAAQVAKKAPKKAKAPKAPKAQVAAKIDPFETFAAPLRDVGLDAKQIKAAWLARA